MKIKRFVAADMRSAMNLVRKEHGPDAVILSNRRIEEGIEIVAAANYDESAVQRALEASRRDIAPPPAPKPRTAADAVIAGSPAAAAARITEILLDPALAQKMGSAGRQWVESTWSWPLIAARLTRLLDGVDPDL